MNLKKKFVIGAASLALVAGMGVAPAMAGGTKVVLPGGQTFDRIAGQDRVATAFEVAKQRMSDKAETTAYLVGANAYVDAATSGMLSDGVVLLMPSDEAGQLKLGLRIKAEMSGITKLVAIGGTGVVSDKAMDNVKSTSGISSIERLGGKDRYETNIAIAKKAFPVASAAGKVAYVTRGDMIVDALAAGTITNGPIVMVPQSGMVPAGTVDYFKAFDKTAGKEVVIGGEGAVPASQVDQLFDVKKSVNPWEYQTTTADLHKAVQKSAALYLGQSAWQQLDGTAPTATCDDGKYFGIAKAAVTDPSNPSPSAVTDAALKDGIDAAKGTDAFIGWKPSYDSLETSVGKINTYVKTLEGTLNTALEAMATGTPKDDANYTKGGTDTAYTAVVDAYKTLYGKDIKLPAVDATGTVTDWGSFEKDALGRFTGKLTSDATGFVKDDAASTDKVGEAGTPAAAMTYAELAGLDMSSLPGDITDKTGGKFDWAALKAAAATKLADQQKKTAEAKKALNDAVAACVAGPTAKVVVGSAAGVPRLAGEDRYATAALISYYLTVGSANGFPAQTTTGGTLPNKLERAYIASGEDAHLVDAVVGGQLVNGPILLVPTSADKLGDYTTAELKRLASVSKDVSTWKTFVLGGTGAVGETSFNAAVEAFKAGLK